MLPLDAKNKYKEWGSILHIAKTSGILYVIISKFHTPITQELTLPPFTQQIHLPDPKSGPLSLTGIQ